MYSMPLLFHVREEYKHDTYEKIQILAKGYP